MKYIFTFIFLAFHFNISSQTISGKIYDGKIPIEDTKVKNITKNLIKYSNSNGVFKIKAAIGDTVIFSSSFYKNKTIIISQNHLDDKFVIVLKVDINDLDEVIINSSPKPKKLDVKNYNSGLMLMIKNDIEENPLEYGYTPTQIVFKEIKKLFLKIFPNKKTIFIPIKYDDYFDLFKNDSIFNDNFLNQDLKISTDHYSLFFDYCEAKQIDSKLLGPKKKILLIELLIKFSLEFNAIMEESKTFE